LKDEGEREREINIIQESMIKREVENEGVRGRNFIRK